MNRIRGRRQAPVPASAHPIADPPPGAERTDPFLLSAGIQADGATICQDEAEWALKNKRRGWLIDKELSEGLTPAEAEELQQLQADVAKYLDQVAPISFEAIEDLEAVARRIAPATDRPDSSETRTR